MKTRLTLSALLIAAALPLAAQADNASERALQLNQETLSAPARQAAFEAQAVDAGVERHLENGSAGLEKARADLQRHSAETHFAHSGDELAPARQATT